MCIPLLIVIGYSAAFAQELCTANNIQIVARIVHGDAKGEGRRVQLAVAWTIRNRVIKRELGYPDSVCSVVSEKGMNAYGTLNNTEHDADWESSKVNQNDEYQSAVTAARQALCCEKQDPTYCATTYCNTEHCSVTRSSRFFCVTFKKQIGGFHFACQHRLSNNESCKDIERSYGSDACPITERISEQGEYCPILVKMTGMKGENPDNGSCLCLTGTNVNARVSASLTAGKVAQLSKPSCRKFHGGMETNDRYTWYELENPSGSTVYWVAGTYLEKGVQSQCANSSSNESCGNKDAQHDACTLKDLHENGKIILSKWHSSKIVDNGYAYNNIVDTCAGLPASRSKYTCEECNTTGAPGGKVCLSSTILQYLLKLHELIGKFRVNELAGACHVCKSRHYQGTAVDLHFDDDKRNMADEMKKLCEKTAGSYVRIYSSHVHCGFPH